MSEVTNVLQTGSQLTTNYDRAKIFLGGNRFATASFKNTGEAEVTLKAGTLMAKATAIAVDTTNNVGGLKVFKSAGTEGGNIPVGILAQDITVAAGATKTGVKYCIAGDFDLDELILDGEDTLATVVDNTVSVTVGTEDPVDVVTWSKAVRELISSETQLIGVSVDQMSALDNQ